MRKNRILIIFLFFIFITINFLFSQKTNIQSALFIQVTPNFNNDLKLISYDTNIVKLYSLFNYKLFEFKSLKNDISKNPLKDSLENAYFIHHKDSIYGYFTTGSTYFGRQHIDQVTYINQILNRNDIETEFNSLKTKLISTDKNEDSSILTENFEISDSQDITYKTIWRMSYSNKLKQLPFSISPYLDSLKNAKFFQIVSENPSKYLKEKNLTMEGFTGMIRLEENNNFDADFIMKKFQQYIQKIGKN